MKSLLKFLKDLLRGVIVHAIAVLVIAWVATHTLHAQPELYDQLITLLHLA